MEVTDWENKGFPVFSIKEAEHRQNSITVLSGT